MSPIGKRNTRSTTIMKEEITTNTSNTASIQENICEQVGVKRSRAKRRLTNEKQSIDEQRAASLCDFRIIDPPIDQPTLTTLQPVSLDNSDNFNDPSASPPPLLIDTTEDTISSQVLDSNRKVQSRLNEKNNPSYTPLENNKKKRLSNNDTHSYSLKDNHSNTNEEPNSTNNKTININKTPTAVRNKSNIHSQLSNQAIVVSVEQSPRNSNGENGYNRRTSTPLCPSRHQQVDNSLVGGYNDSFSMDSIHPETHKILSQFPEYRRLVKAYNTEKRNCANWVNDYARLRRNYQQLEENSFPRPSASALSYLVDLVTQIQQKSGRDDPRNDETLAEDLGVNQIVLMTLKDKTPQQTALNLFNHLYPGYQAKINLGSVDNMELLKPGLFQSILVFAQRAVPGVPYKSRDLREALSNSIRGARYQLRRTNGAISNAASLFENGDADQDDSRRVMDQNANQDKPSDDDDLETDEFI